MGISVSKGSASTVTFSQPQEIIISHLDDSIRVGDGSNLAAVTTANRLKVESEEVQLSKRVDEASATVTYVGAAAAGASESDAVWQISRLTTSGSVLTVQWADGNTNFDNNWANRASLTYS